MSETTILENADGLVVCLSSEDTEISGILKEVDEALDGEVSRILAQPDVKSARTFTRSYIASKGCQYKRIFVVGLGDKKTLTYNDFREKAAILFRASDDCKYDSLYWVFPEGIPLDAKKITQAVGEGIKMGRFQFNFYKTNNPDAENTTQNIILNIPSEEDYSEYLIKGQTIANGVNLARALMNTPSNYKTPEMIKEAVVDQFKDTDVTVTVIDKTQAKSLGMGAFLGVAQGSANDPYFLILSYTPIEDQKPIALVGKGVTFDSGGISIKPSKGMKDMKGDMGGAAAVIGAMQVIKDLKVQRNVVGYVPLVENMPSGSAQRPGDVVFSYSGHSIEIVNTDAEGRLILADALSYAEKKGATAIIDIATLTGGAVVALGSVASAIMSNDDDLVKTFYEASEYTGEKVWHMPLFDEYKDLLKSSIADIAHCTEKREASTCSAGKFLELFIKDTPWLHIDMAPVMENDGSIGHRPKGMSGAGVQNLVEYVLTQA